MMRTGQQQQESRAQKIRDGLEQLIEVVVEPGSGGRRGRGHRLVLPGSGGMGPSEPYNPPNFSRGYYRIVGRYDRNHSIWSYRMFHIRRSGLWDEFWVPAAEPEETRRVIASTLEDVTVEYVSSPPSPSSPQEIEQRPPRESHRERSFRLPPREQGYVKIVGRLQPLSSSAHTQVYGKYDKYFVQQEGNWVEYRIPLTESAVIYRHIASILLDTTVEHIPSEHIPFPNPRRPGF